MSFRQRFNDSVQQRVHSFDPVHVAVCTLQASCALYYKMFHFTFNAILAKGIAAPPVGSPWPVALDTSSSLFVPSGRFRSPRTPSTNQADWIAATVSPPDGLQEKSRFPKPQELGRTLSFSESRRPAFNELRLVVL